METNTTTTTLQNLHSATNLADFPRSLFDNKPDDVPVQSQVQVQTSPVQLLSPMLLQTALGGSQNQQQLLWTAPNQLTTQSTASGSNSNAMIPSLVSLLNTSNSNNQSANNLHTKKCLFHRQFVRPLHQQLLQNHQQQQQQIRISNQIVSTTNIQNSSNSNRTTHVTTRDAITTNPLPPLNAALLQDRYLLLDLVDGSSFHKCVDIRTQKMLVCKVSVIFYCSMNNLKKNI